MTVDVAPPDFTTSQAASLEAESHLVVAAKAGDGLAFRRLVEPHLGVLLRIARRGTSDPAVAEDAVQECLTLAFQRLHRYRHDKSFRAYLAAIAAKQAYTLARGERRRRHREEASAAPPVPATPEENAEAARAAAQVRDALGEMTEKRRRAVLLRLDGGLSYREIAEAMGSTEGAARVLVHAALKELRSHLNAWMENKDHDSL